MAYLTRGETEVGDAGFRTDDVLGTTLIVGTQGFAIGEDKAVDSKVSYVAHDVAIVPLAVILSHDGIPVAVAGFNA